MIIDTKTNSTIDSQDPAFVTRTPSGEGYSASINRSSMIFNVLPAVVQSRIPAIPSIRRTLSDFRDHASPGRRTPREETVEPDTPPPVYCTRAGSARSSSTRNSIDSVDVELPFEECVSTRPHSSMGTPPPFHIPEGRTGINWRYANQGISLTTQAYAESHTLAYRDETSISLTRQLYIHGLTYLLRALPSDLTSEETLGLQAATPASLVIIQTEPCNHAIVPFIQESSSPQEPPSDASALHRITAIIVFQAFIMVEFLLPYIKLFIGHAYRFERENKLTQKLVSNGLVTADVLRKRSLQLSHSICQMNDGKVGQALNDLAIWWVRGLTGGLQQGITEGFTMLSNERTRTPKKLEKADEKLC